MKKRWLSLCTAGLLAANLCSPAAAASLNSIRPNMTSIAVSAVKVPVVYPPDTEGTVSFQNLESRLRKHNTSIISLQNALDIQKKFDREGTRGYLVHTINSLVDDGKDIPGFNANIEAMRAQLDALKEDKYQETLDTLSHQIENSIQKIIQGAQSLYLNIVSTEVTLSDLTRSITTLDNTVAEMELRVSLGQASELTLSQLKANQQSLKSQKASLELGLEKMHASLALMLGESPKESLKLSALPTDWRKETLAKKDYETALKEVKGKSYTVYAAEKSLKDAKKEWNDAQGNLLYKTHPYLKAEQTYKTALSTYDNSLKNFDLTFKNLYQAVSETQQALQASEATLAYQEKLYSAAKLKYEQGQISQKQLKTAEDELLSARSAMTTAEMKAFTAYQQYQTAFIPDAI